MARHINNAVQRNLGRRDALHVTHVDHALMEYTRIPCPMNICMCVHGFAM